MRKTFITLITAMLAAGPLAASDDKTEVMAVLNRWVDSFNKGDTKLFVMTCADRTSIIGAFSLPRVHKHEPQSMLDR